MKSKAILVFLMTFVAIAAVAMASASNISVSFANVQVDGTYVDGNTIAVGAGETVPVVFDVVSNEASDLTDATVSAWIEGHKAQTEVEMPLRDLISGTSNHVRLAMTMPTKMDDNTEEEMNLIISVDTDSGTFTSDNYPLLVEKKPYNANFLFVDADNSVTAGSNLPVTVVVRNDGRHDLTDLVLTVGIPALGIQKKVFVGDLVPNETCNDDCNNNDVKSISKTVTLAIPSNAVAGTYDMTIEASNSDVDTKVAKSITVSGSQVGSAVYTALTSKDVAAGSSVTYDLVIVNSGDSIAVYNVVPETTSNLDVSVDQPIVSISAGSSAVVKVTAAAKDVTGTVNFGVNVNSAGQLVQRVALTANVTKGKTMTSNVIALTVVLAIIFIVLLIVLIVLLTRKPAKTEEFGESYY